MNGCSRGGLNGFCSASHSACWPVTFPVPGPPGPPGPAGPSGGLAAYGSIFQDGDKTFAVTYPGKIVPVTFDNNAVLSSGVMHKPGTSNMEFALAGDYEICFQLNVLATAAAPVTFAIQVNETNLSCGVFSRMLVSGFQTIMGSAMTTLAQNDAVRLVLTAPSALSITLAGTRVAGLLQIKKLN